MTKIIDLPFTLEAKLGFMDFVIPFLIFGNHKIHKQGSSCLMGSGALYDDNKTIKVFFKASGRCTQDVALFSFGAFKHAMVIVLLTKGNYYQVWDPNGVYDESPAKRLEEFIHNYGAAMFFETIFGYKPKKGVILKHVYLNVSPKMCPLAYAAPQDTVFRKLLSNGRGICWLWQGWYLKEMVLNESWEKTETRYKTLTKADFRDELTELYVEVLEFKQVFCAIVGCDHVEASIDFAIKNPHDFSIAYEDFLLKKAKAFLMASKAATDEYQRRLLLETSQSWLRKMK